jgi:HPt (histidine-containing phosphotransfer) domain-containing protein
VSFVDLNTSRLDDITGGDPQMNGELVRIVLEDAESAIGRLVSSLDERDAALGAAHAHQLKGLCANVGADRLADAALRLERSISDGDWAATGPLFDEALAALAALRGVVASL